MTKGRNASLARSKWFVPLFSLVLGLVMLAVSGRGGHPVQPALAVLAAFGLVILLAALAQPSEQLEAA